jgi:alkylation response protein AidB-like acyl-CoA dehydrogenase
MNFEPNSEHDAFRAEVRRFFKDHLPPDLARRTYIGAHSPAVEDYRTCQRMLNSRGWGAPHWPVEWGGTTWSAMKRHVFMEELYEADVLDYGWQGTHMIGPVIIAFGSDAQRRRFLPPMINGDEYWCQGFSEPNAGSDLASLRTRAQLVGQEWVISGQKIWTSDAHYADWGFFLVRTDTSVKPQRGLSLLLVPMNSAGVRVRPIESIHGGHDLNEVFLDDVRVPAGNIVGEAGKGWTYAKYLLDKERTASASLYQNKRELEKVKVIAREETIDDRRLIDTPAFARKIALIEADMLALQWSVLRLLAEEKNSHDPDAVVSALKIRGSELLQRVSQLQIEALGPRALRAFEHGENPGAEVLLGTPEWPAHVPGRTAQFLYLRAATIFGGSREIQKNIIAKRAFGL